MTRDIHKIPDVCEGNASFAGWVSEERAYDPL